ncbi:uncharacterized protein CG3556 [Caerostris darwini]|uniref:Uncharacterized protein CG3556 n=1 Tax=Caerostris darwini TaxID=1538125 RepID=A0AAV4WPN1_9ARAC|nr:uncharacterized protein CG3556 [Caerostris darwini]
MKVDAVYGVFAVKGIAESRHKAAKWLKNKWSSSTGWQENTHRGIIAWYLATGNNATDIHIDDSLMVNRLVIETLASLLRNKTSPLTINQLSMFVNALTVSCRDPRNFHGFDLVKILKQQTEISSLTNRPISYLALCNAGESIPLNETAKLVDILNSRSKYPFLPDVQAASIMALSCLCYNKDDKSIQIPYIKVGYDRIVEKFKKLQQVDGSFGTIYTTAIVTQALLSARQENDKGWKLNITVNYLMKYLNSPSVDFLATYWTLPILNGKSLSDIKNTDCPVVLQKNSEGPMMKDVKVNLRSKMRVQYSLYIGDEKDIIHTISLRVPENITVYEVMQLAEVADYKYKCRYLVHHNAQKAVCLVKFLSSMFEVVTPLNIAHDL